MITISPRDDPTKYLNNYAVFKSIVIKTLYDFKID